MYPQLQEEQREPLLSTGESERARAWRGRVIRGGVEFKRAALRRQRMTYCHKCMRCPY